jgi:hypothetical protein
MQRPSIAGDIFGYTVRDRFIAGARYNAVRRLVVALVMLILSIAVFRRTFVWLNPREAVT